MGRNRIDISVIILVLRQSNVMEVHHHPDLHHKKKKFSEYFLEFLMIFLAVSMGFIAENVREGRSERHKEREYVEGLVRDLRQDTANLRTYIRLNQTKVAGMDTLLSLAGRDMSTPANKLLFYRCCRMYMSSVAFFKSVDVTLAQLKSTGGYRLFRQSSIADKIAAYDQSIPRLYVQEQTYDKSLLYAQEMLFEIADMTVFSNPLYFNGREPTGKELPALLNDAQKLKIYFNRVVFARMVVVNYSDHFLINQLHEATELIGFLKEAYGLGNE